MSVITVLHVSDAHFGAPDPNEEQQRITKALVSAAHDSVLSPDLCVFTGDLAFSGDAIQFDIGGRWLAELLQPWNCPLFLVPGNHDIERRFARHEKLRPAYQSEESYRLLRSNLQADTARFDAFWNWHRSAGESGLPLVTTWPGEIFLNHGSLIVDEITVQMICVNTSVLSCADDDMGKLLIDIPSLNSALHNCKPDSELVVVVGHHPIEDWLVPWNADLVSGILSQMSGAHLYLHGHAHSAQGEAASQITGQSVTVLGAGAAYQGSKWPQGFAFYEIDCLARTIQPHNFLYNHDSGSWQRHFPLSQPLTSLLPNVRLPKTGSRTAHKDRSTSQMPSTPNDTVDVEVYEDSMNAAEVSAEEAPTNATGMRYGESLEVGARRLHHAAQLTQRRLSSALDAWERSADICYARKTRVKTVPRILDKVERYHADQRLKDPLGQINDACGFRLVTYFQFGISEAVEHILDLIAHRTDWPSPFVEGSPVSIEIYTSRPDMDPLSIVPAVQRVAKDCGLEVNMATEARISGYSSVHIVAQCGVRSNDPRLPKSIGVEFQVRSAFEEVWGEIDHKLRYRTGIDTSSGMLWHHHLKALKTLVDGCIQYTDLIRMQANNDPRVDVSGESSRTLTSSTAVLTRLKGIPRPYYDELEKAYEVWGEAERKNEQVEAQLLYHEAGDAFRVALSHATEFIASGDPMASEYHYWVRMELAYCLLKSADRANLLVAERIYQTIEGELENDAVSRFRHGTVLRRRGRLRDASKKYRESIDILENDRDERVHREHWAHAAVWRNLGYVYWSLSKQYGATPVGWDAQLSDLRSAIVCTQRALSAHAEHEDHLRSINNIVYYGWAERQVPLESADLALDQHIYEDYIGRLQKSVDLETSTNDMHMDTLCRSLRSLGSQEGMTESKAVADRILTVMKERIQSRSGVDLVDTVMMSDDWAIDNATRCLDVDELDTFLFALAISRSS